MPVQYITLGYVNTEIGAETSMTLLGVTTSTVLTSHSTATQWIEGATDVVRSALDEARYDLPAASNATPLLKRATFGQYLYSAYRRRNFRVPDQWISDVNLADAIRNRQVRVPGITERNARDEVGGVKFSKRTSGNKPNVMGSLRKEY